MIKNIVVFVLCALAGAYALAHFSALQAVHVVTVIAGVSVTGSMIAALVSGVGGVFLLGKKH